MLTYKNFIVVSVVITSLSALLSFPATAPAQTKLKNNTSTQNLITLTAQKKIPSTEKKVVVTSETPTKQKHTTKKLVRNEVSLTKKNSVSLNVPFYSQFKDIMAPSWQKVGCGIASVAMIISYYEKSAVSVDKLLKEGIANGAYLADAGWTHQGLINLARKFKLDGQSHSLIEDTTDTAFTKLEAVLKNGPVMASVHYTFEPTNPIPHIVVVHEVRNGEVYYNDPAEQSGDGHISIAKFKKAWKKRYIEIRPIT